MNSHDELIDPRSYPDGDPTTPPDRTRLLIETLPDGTQRAWVHDLSRDRAWMRGACRPWLDWLRAHGINPSDVCAAPAIIRDPTTRTVSVGFFGTPDEPGARIVDEASAETPYPTFLKYRHTVQLEAEPLPFPTDAHPQPDPGPASPDCTFGKHLPCSGDAWDYLAATPVDCACHCHTPETDTGR